MKPRLFEALMQKDNDQKHAYEQLKPKADSNPFLKRYVREGIKRGCLVTLQVRLDVCMTLWLMQRGQSRLAEQ